MFRSTTLPALALLLVVAGCAPAPTVPAGPDRATLERPAKALLAKHQYREAAQAYLRLAKTAPAPLAADFVLAAASALIDAGQLDSASHLVESGVSGTLPSPLAQRRDLLRARILLAQGRAKDALALLPENPSADLPVELRAHIGEARARALAATGQELASARERVHLDLLLTDERALRANRRALWETVQHLPPAAFAERAPPPDTLSGWIELAQLVKSAAVDPALFDKAIAAWRTRYPGHPAGDFILPEIMETLKMGGAPAHIALLIPFDGPFRDAARAIRDGFMAAWYADRANPRRPVISVHDSASGDIRAVYDAAVKGGADFVVGPLERNAVTALAATKALPVTTLALNTLSPGPADSPEARKLPAGLYQFSLAPEEEAKRVAERAWADGLHRAGILVPEGDWGSRVGKAFASSWTALGGVVAVTQTYPNDAPDMSEPVKKFLNIDQSEQRFAELRRVLGVKLEFEPVARTDLDVVLMGAFPRQARQLRPQLKFHHAAGLPVYATSHAYAGTPDPQADIDIDGVTIGDMPWVLESTVPGQTLREAVKSAWPNSVGTYLRLYAFGVDAYRLVPRLARLKLDPGSSIEGATGRLSLDADNRVRRHLVWARFVKGWPVLLPSAPAGSQ